MQGLAVLLVCAALLVWRTGASVTIESLSPCPSGTRAFEWLHNGTTRAGCVLHESGGAEGQGMGGSPTGAGVSVWALTDVLTADECDRLVRFADEQALFAPPAPGSYNASDPSIAAPVSPLVSAYLNETLRERYGLEAIRSVELRVASWLNVSRDQLEYFQVRLPAAHVADTSLSWILFTDSPRCAAGRVACH
jgi:hypothetical protein